MKIKKIFTIVALLLFVLSIRAQQYPLFSNYFTNSYGFNPAIVGSTPGWDARFVLRKQWVGIEDAPSTQIFHLGGRLFKNIGVGANLFNDVAGQLKRTGGSLTATFVKDLGGLTFSAGVSGGLYDFKLAKGVNTGEDGDGSVILGLDKHFKPDFSAGLYVNSKRFFAGFSVPQLPELGLDLSDTKSDLAKLFRHYYLMGGVHLNLNENLKLTPMVIAKFFEKAPIQFDVGTRITYDNKYWLGGNYRIGDAATAMVGMNIKKFNIAYAYDLTVSDLRKVNSGSHEISLGYHFGGKKKVAAPPVVDEIIDTDKDGIPDAEDDCPLVYGKKRNKGCPQNDRDQDGIADNVDKCPDIKGSSENQGCPYFDTDNDGVRDKDDKCPNLAGDPSNFGCPLADIDKDGIPDNIDKCPNTYGIASNNGCPEVTQREMEILHLAIRNVYFDTDKWDIRPEHYPFLNDLANVLIEHRDWKVRVTGHADYRGSQEHNIMLSKNRAKSVTYYLMNKGVQEEQFIVSFFGENVPAINKDTPEGLQLNRRVELEYIFH